MPRIKNTPEEEPDTKPVRRTRATSSVTDSPVRRSTRKKASVDSPPESVKETISVPRRVLRKRSATPEQPESVKEALSIPKRSLRKRSPTPDLEVNTSKRVLRKPTPTPDPESSQTTTRSTRRRNLRSESEAPATPPRVTRRTRANSVTESTKLDTKNPAASAKNRRRFVSVPVEPSLLEDDNEESPEHSLEDKQNSSHESPNKSSDDQLEETNASFKDEINESSVLSDGSVMIIDEVTGVKSIVRKKERYNAIEKRIMKRLMVSKLDYSNNDSLVESTAENNFEAGVDSEDKMDDQEERNSEVFKEKTPRRSKEKRSSGEKSFEDGDDNKMYSFVESPGEMKKETPKKKEKGKGKGEKSPFKKQTPNGSDQTNEDLDGMEISNKEESSKFKSPIEVKTPNRKQTPNKKETPKIKTPIKEKTPNREQTPKMKTPNKTETTNGKETPNRKETPKSKTPIKYDTPGKKDTPNKSKTPIKIDTPDKKDTPNKSKSPKEKTPVKFANEYQDFIGKNQDEDFEEPMDVDMTSENVVINSDQHESDLEVETIDIPEKMSRDFKPRYSMIDIKSEKHSSMKNRHSLGNKKLGSDELDLAKEREKYLERKNRQSLQKIDSETDELESNFKVNGLAPDENTIQLFSTSEKRRSSSEKRKSTSDRNDSLSYSPASFKSPDTPGKGGLLKSASKNSEKKSRKRKREVSESDSSFQLTMLGYEDESLVEKDVDKLDGTDWMPEENSDDEAMSRSRNSSSKRKSKLMVVDESVKETDEESNMEKKTPNSLRKKRFSEDSKEEKTPKDKNKCIMMSESLEEGEIPNSEIEESGEEKTPNSLRKKKRFSKDSKLDVPEFEKKATTPKHKNKSLLMSESLEKGISNSEAEIPNSKEDDPNSEDISNSEDAELEIDSKILYNETKKRRSKTRSFGETEIPKSRKSLDKKNTKSRSLGYIIEESGEKTGNQPEENAEIESGSQDLQLEPKSKKPVIKNIEIFGKESDQYKIGSRLEFGSEQKRISEKTPEKLNKSRSDEKELKRAGEDEESSDEESSSDGSGIFETVKKARKSKSIGTTPSLTPMKSRFDKLKNLKADSGSGKKSRLGKKAERDEKVESKIPAFMFSQTSSESEDEEASGEDASRSIDSDIAKEYNLEGETITHYSDDDVPADDCRGSESEHSDSQDDGSDMADFINDDDEEEDQEEEEEGDEDSDEDSDDSVFEVETKKSTKASRIKVVVESDEEVDEESAEEVVVESVEEVHENEVEPSPSKNEKKRKSQNNSLKITETDPNREILDQKDKIDDDEEEIKKQERKIERMEVQIQEHSKQLEDEEESPALSFDESDLEISNAKKLNKSLSKSPVKKVDSGDSPIEDNGEKPKSKKKKKESDSKLSKSKNDSEEEEKQEETSKKKKKSKRELKSTASKIPVACSTLYEASDSEEAPDSISFADARNEELEALKKKSESIKAGKEAKKKKKMSEAEKEMVTSGSIKRLPDEILQDLEDIPRPLKKMKLSKKGDLEVHTGIIHECMCPKKKKKIGAASTSGSTTEFEVVSLQKEKKQKSQSNLALKWYKERMVNRNVRQPISVHLSKQQKRKAAGKDKF